MTIVTGHQRLEDIRRQPLKIIRHQTLYTRDQQTLKTSDQQTLVTIHQRLVDTKHLPLDTKDKRFVDFRQLTLQKLETRIKNLETRNQKLETKNQKLERKRQVNRGFLHFIYFFLTLYSINKCICVIMKEIRPKLSKTYFHILEGQILHLNGKMRALFLRIEPNEFFFLNM